MKNLNLKSTLIILCFITGKMFSQTPGEWTWMNGSNVPDSVGVYGTQGVSSPANTPRH